MTTSWLRRGLVALVAALAAAVGAAPPTVDANRAERADLEAVRGVGPTLADAILEARAQRRFDDWSDFIGRVRGVGAASARRLSAAGLTIDGAPHDGAAPPGSSAASKPAARGRP